MKLETTYITVKYWSVQCEQLYSKMNNLSGKALRVKFTNINTVCAASVL